MAHFYDCTNVSEVTDVEGEGLKALDPVSRKALVRFWLSVLAVIAASVAFYFFSKAVLLPAASLGLAFVAAAVGIFSLILLDRSAHQIHLVSSEQAQADRRVFLTLQQLDDRFAVFNGVCEGNIWIDHLIVGPSGVYAVKTSMLTQQRTRPVRSDLVQAQEARRGIEKLLKPLLAQRSLDVEPVLCVVGQDKPMVRQEIYGVWLVSLDKLVSALLRRSGQEGAISKNVNITGAFSADLPQVRALEQALAEHWNLPRRPVLTDYLPTPNMLASQN